MGTKDTDKASDMTTREKISSDLLSGMMGNRNVRLADIIAKAPDLSDSYAAIAITQADALIKMLEKIPVKP